MSNQKSTIYGLFNIFLSTDISNGVDGKIITTSSLQHKRQTTDTELYRISPVVAFVIGFCPALLGAIATITIALIFHNDLITNYNWQCGRARLPSLSRIINLPFERIFWQFCILFHIPIRVMELIIGFCRYDRLMNTKCKHQWYYQLARYCYLYVGIGELLFLGGLSIIGERELILVHVILFYIFGFCGIGFFIANLVCHGQSLYYLKPYGHLSYSLKLAFATGYFIITPLLISAFLLYWRACVTAAYDVFAICEYTEVLLNIGYHGCTYFDIRYNVTFSVRIDRRINEQQRQQKAIKSDDIENPKNCTN